MSRLTDEERKEYEEEAEYAQQNGSYRPQHRASVYERIVAATKGTVQKAQEVNNGPTGQAVRRFAQRTNAQDYGFSGGGSGVHGYARFSNDSPQPPVNPGSALHPGNRLYVIEGSIVASGGGKREKEPRRRGPGGANPAFGNDNGL